LIIGTNPTARIYQKLVFRFLKKRKIVVNRSKPIPIKPKSRFFYERIKLETPSILIMKKETMIEFEYNYLKDTDTDILLSLNNLIETYKEKYYKIRLGISEKDSDSVFLKFNERGEQWKKIFILYKIKTLYMLNIIEFWLIDEHWDIYTDKYISEAFDVMFKKEKYLYVLVQ